MVRNFGKTLAAAFLAVGLTLALAGQGPAAMVFMTSTGNTTADNLTQAVLQSQGHTVTIGPQYLNFTGAGLAGHDLVLLAPSYNWNDGTTNMPAAGQAAILDFVSGGGGLVTVEWTIWKRAAQGSFATLDPLFPVVPTSQFRTVATHTYVQNVFDPILSSGLPASFTFPADDVAGTETFFAARPGATVYYNSVGFGAAVVGWDFGLGRVLEVSTVAGIDELNNANYARLLGNSVNWATAQQTVIPEPSSLALVGVGAVGMGLAWRRRMRWDASSK